MAINIYEPNAFVIKPFEYNIQYYEDNVRGFQQTISLLSPQVLEYMYTINKSLPMTCANPSSLYNGDLHRLLTIQALDKQDTIIQENIFNNLLNSITSSCHEFTDITPSNDIVQNLLYKYDINRIINDVQICINDLSMSIARCIAHLIYVQRVKATLDKLNDELNQKNYHNIFKCYDTFRQLLDNMQYIDIMNCCDIDDLKNILSHFKLLLADRNLDFEMINAMYNNICNRLLSIPQIQDRFNDIFNNEFVVAYFNRFKLEKKLCKIKHFVKIYKKPAVYHFVNSCKPVHDKIILLLESERIIAKL